MRKIKSLISVLVAVCVILSCSLVASAAGASISASASKTNVKPGDTITVSVSLNSNTGVAGLDFTLTYNTSQLEYQSSSVGSAGSSFLLKSVNKSGSAVRGAYLNVDGTTTSSTGSLATITFKVIASSTASSPLSLSASGTDSNGNVVSVGASGTTLSISSATTKPVATTKPTTKPTTTKPTTTKPTTTEATTETTTEAESTTKVITTETIGVKKGNAYQLAKPSSMTGKVKYSSSKTSVATVSDTGVITTLAKGMTTITAVSENGVTKNWLLIVGDDSMVETESTTELEEEESTTEISVIGSVTEENTTEEETTEETEDTNKKDKGDETFRLIFGTGAAVAVLIIIIIIASMIRKRRSFVE